MGDKIFDIGDWIGTEDGLGQVLYNREIYYQEFDKATRKGKKGGFIRVLYICKILCGFEGEIKKRFSINVYTSISLLTLKEKKYIDIIKIYQKNRYNQYILFEPKESLTRKIFLEYRIDDSQLDLVRNGIREVRKNLPRTFTFNEFKKEFKKVKMPFDVSNFIKYGEPSERSETVTLRFDSYLYKVKGKDALFLDVHVIKI